ncbi:hypothetical protein DY000_02036329 [Brassica cretica]|uniref:Uncharacterized protein n=1 Tax=Brassica cretica TaxID=69181 RepID=A0ABQ7B5M2_BRACR|nr:hypothetical protein DY000_02036329 [Brassica cretica]
MQSFLLFSGSEDLFLFSTALGLLRNGCSVELLSLHCGCSDFPVNRISIGSPAKILCRR